MIFNCTNPSGIAWRNCLAVNPKSVPELLPDWNLSRIRELFGNFLGTFDKNKKVLWYLKKIGSFLGAFLGAFDNYVEILCYFGSFFYVFKAFWGIFDQFWNGTEFSVLFSVLFPEKLRIWENSRISGAGNSSASDHMTSSKPLIGQHPFFFLWSDEVTRWRVCYQRGLPRLIYISETTL